MQIYLHADLGMAIYGLHGPKSSNPKKGCLEYLSTWSPIHPWIWSIWHLILPTHSMICIYKTWYRKSGWNLTNPSESTFQKKYFWDIVEFLPFWVGEHQRQLAATGTARVVNVPSAKTAEAVRAESSLPSVNGTSKVGGGAVVAISCADYKHSMFLFLHAISINVGFGWFVKLKKIESYRTNSCGKTSCVLLVFLVC